jgi:AraC-like DNA-binding protein
LFLSGASTIRQLGREIRDSPGAGIVLSGNDPFVLSRYREGSFLSIPVARSRVAELAPDVDAAYGTRIPAESEALQLLSRYARAVSDGKFNTPALADAAGGHIVDLVALAIGASSEAAEESRKRGLAAARLMAVKATISAQARKPDLSIAMVAQLHGLTPRYIHKLFEREGTTFSAFLLDRRLGLAHGRLKELRFATHTVASIAFDCGFNDLSYFNRTFRRAYGATPSEIREISFREIALQSE